MNTAFNKQRSAAESRDQQTPSAVSPNPADDALPLSLPTNSGQTSKFRVAGSQSQTRLGRRFPCLAGSIANRPNQNADSYLPATMKNKSSDLSAEPSSRTPSLAASLSERLTRSELDRHNTQIAHLARMGGRLARQYRNDQLARGEDPKTFPSTASLHRWRRFYSTYQRLSRSSDATRI